MVGGCHPQAPLDYQLCEAPEARAVPYAVESLPVSRDPPSPPGRHDDGPLAGCPPKLDAGAGSRESPPAGAHLGCAPCRGKCGLLGAWFGPQSPPSTHRAQSSGVLGGLRPLPRPYCAISLRPRCRSSRAAVRRGSPLVRPPPQECSSRPAGGSDPGISPPTGAQVAGRATLPSVLPQAEYALRSSWPHPNGSPVPGPPRGGGPLPPRV